MKLARNRLFVAGTIVLGVVSAGQGRVDMLAQTSHDVTQAMVEQWMTELSNWGRWGDDDQLGALNLITPEKRKQAAALVREGISVSLSHDYLTERAADATSPLVHEMLGLARPGPFVSDRYTIAYHGYAHSHMDALCHMALDGVMYNGFTRVDHVTEDGCGKLAILDVKQGIMTKGVLMDIARLKGVDYLEPGTQIYCRGSGGVGAAGRCPCRAGGHPACTRRSLGASRGGGALGHRAGGGRAARVGGAVAPRT